MSIGSTLDEAFGIQTMIDMVETFDTSADDSFFADLYRKSLVTFDGDTVNWDQIKYDRGLAPVVGFESPPQQVKNLDRVKRSAAAAKIELYTDISGHRIYKERGPGSLKANAEQVIATEIKNLKLRVAKTINYMAVNLLLGSLDINGTNIPGTEITIPTITVPVTAYTRTASWATAGTAILSSELDLLVNDVTNGYIAKSGRRPGLAVCNSTVENYLIANTEVQNWAKQMFGSAALLRAPAAAEFFGGYEVGGLKWLKNVNGYVNDGQTTLTKFMPDGTVIVLPPMDGLGEILAMAEGHGLVPSNAVGTEDGANGIISEYPTPGIYAYVTLIPGFVGVRVVVGWIGLPIVKFPGAVTNAAVS